MNLSNGQEISNAFEFISSFVAHNIPDDFV